MLELIQKRPVRFSFLVEAILGLAAFLLGISPEVIVKAMLIVNAGLAFFVEGFTTPVSRDGTPISPLYEKK